MSESVCDAGEGTVCPRTARSARLAELAFSSSSLKLLGSKTSVAQKQVQNQPFVHTHFIKKVCIQRDLDRLEEQPSISIKAEG